jgi:C-terminal processing protease CtpA/Prc
MSSSARSCTAIIAAVAFALIAVPLHAHAQGSFPAPERRKIQDILNAVRTQIAQKYYDSTFRGVNMQANYDSASAHIRDAISPDAALGAIAWYALQLNDSHTFFAPPSQTVSVEYGWNTAMIGDTCVVIEVNPESDAARQGVHVGDQLLNVNGFVPGRENLWQMNYVYRVLRPQAALHVAMRAPNSAPRELNLAAKVREHSKIIDLSGADGGRDLGQLIREGEKDADKYRGLYLDVSNQVIVWKMPTFEVPLAQVRDVIAKAKNRKALIIDLRGNAGGYVAAMLEMVKQVNRDSVVIGMVQERRKMSPLVAKGGGANAFAGDLYVLVDSRSASASEMFARAIQLSKRGQVIGDHTAGAVMQSLYYPLSVGMDTRMFFGVQITEADVIMSDGGRLEHSGVTPDEMLLPTTADLAARRDPVLARAITLAGVPVDAEKAGALYPQKAH